MNPVWTIFLNNNSGAFKVSPTRDSLARLASEVGLATVTIETPSPDDMRQQIKQSLKEGNKHFIIAGGDGTLACAVQELAEREVTLGIIPLGTHNNFAASLGIPKDPKSALQIIKSGRVCPVSVGKAGDRYFIEGAGVGLLADALAAYGEGSHGNPFRGLLVLVRLLFSLRLHYLKLQLDGQAYADKAIMCTVANTFRLGAALPVAPNAILTDNLFDIVIIGDLTWREIIPYYKALRAHKHLELPKVSHLKAKTVTLDGPWKMQIHVDDTIVGLTPLTITLLPKALNVIVPV